MKRIIILFLLLMLGGIHASAAELDYTAPPVPESGEEFLYKEPESFGDGLRTIIRQTLPLLHPAFSEAASTCMQVIGISLLLSVIDSFKGIAKSAVRLIGAASLSAALLSVSGTMIPMANATIQDLNTYGKLLLPVMAGALAAQGGVTTSGALYAGTALFNSILIGMINRIFIPAVYAFLALAVASSALEERFLPRLKDMIKGTTTWALKITLYVFTGYMTVTGAISGSTDAIAMKAAKITISGVVPVVGSILADASEAVLISSAVMKNTAGVYGILAVLAVVIEPFVRLGAQYILIKLTAAFCGSFGGKTYSELILDFSSAMGLLLAMTAAVSIMLLISTVCFMKVVH